MSPKKKLNHARQIIENSFKRAWFARLIAKLIDLVIVVVASFFVFPLGFFIGIIYLSIGDSLWCGQSIGKRFMGMRVIDLETGEKPDYKQSALRNLPLTAPLVFMLVPILGWIIGLILFVAFCAIEIYLFTSLRSTQRLGDMMAETTVIAIDGKKPEAIKVKRTSWFEPSPCEN